MFRVEKWTRFYCESNKKPFKIKKGDFIGSIAPLDPNSTSNYITTDMVNSLLSDSESINSVLHVQSDELTKIKKKSVNHKVKKPFLAREEDFEQDKLSDFDIIKQDLKYDKSLLNDSQQKQLENLVSTEKCLHYAVQKSGAQRVLNILLS